MANAPKNWVQRAVWVAAFIVAFLVVRELKQNWNEKRDVERATAQMDKMKAEAAKEMPDVPTVTALQQKGTELSEAKLATQSGAKKSETASEMYFGFFALNTKARPAVCIEQGVDIPAWSAAFAKVNAPETARAREIFATTVFDENHWYGLMADQMKKFVTEDMIHFATAHKVSLPEACKLFQDHADVFAAEMSFADVQPVIYKALMIP
jgi:hypothetical protein